jgi:hypothetical protein
MVCLPGKAWATQGLLRTHAGGRTAMFLSNSVPVHDLARLSDTFFVIMEQYLQRCEDRMIRRQFIRARGPLDNYVVVDFEIWPSA